MKLFNWLFKNSSKSNNVNLVNLQDFIKMPPSSFYNKHNEEYQKYYKEYTKVLKEKRSLTSVDITINEDINLHINNITRSILELDKILDPVNNNVKRNNIDLKIIISKLKYYMIELNDYKDKLFIKWKVLKDINKIIFLSNNKRCAINERINSIINELVIVNSNMNAISLEISTYLNLIDASNIKIIDSTNEFLTKRYNTLKEYLRLFDIFCDSENVNIESIVYMEILLEKYFATYDVVNSVKQDIPNIHKYNNNYLVNDLINKVIAYKTFTNKDVNDLLKELVNIKFDILTNMFYHDNYKSDFINVDNMNELEFSFLEAKMIEYLNKIKCEYKDKTFDIIQKILKTENGYDMKDILSNPLKLYLIFGFQSNETRIFEKIKLETKRFPIVEQSTYTYTFEDKISLLTLFRLFYHQLNFTYEDIKLLKSQETFKNEKIIPLTLDQIKGLCVGYDNLYLLFQLFCTIPKYKFERFLYDGMKIANFQNHGLSFYLRHEMDKIKFYQELFSVKNINYYTSFYINKELECLDFSVGEPYKNLVKCSGMEIQLNSDTLKSVTINVPVKSIININPFLEELFVYSKVEKIIFENFENSIILHNRKKLRSLIRSLFATNFNNNESDVLFILNSYYNLSFKNKRIDYLTINVSKIAKRINQRLPLDKIIDIVTAEVIRKIPKEPIKEQADTLLK